MNMIAKLMELAAKGVNVLITEEGEAWIAQEVSQATEKGKEQKVWKRA